MSARDPRGGSSEPARHGSPDSAKLPNPMLPPGVSQNVSPNARAASLPPLSRIPPSPPASKIPPQPPVAAAKAQRLATPSDPERVPSELRIGGRRRLLASTPAWLVSLIFHTIVLILLGVLFFPEEIAARLEITIPPSDPAEPLVEADLRIPSLDDLATSDSTLEMGGVEAPRAIVPPMRISLMGVESVVEVGAPGIAMALTGREAGAKRSLLAAYGGTAATESSVGLALEWLRRNQRRDGTWSLLGPYSNPGGNENETAATAMALLAFLGSGETTESGQYRDVVERAAKSLLAMQDRDGNFFQRGLENHRLYSQAQATIAICELYGMTRDKSFRDGAQRSLDYAVRIQADSTEGGGGWRYMPGDGVDTSVTGWFVMALQSGKMAGLNVSDEALRKVDRFLDEVTEDGIEYRYRFFEKPTITMTAEALLCRQYLGWSHNDGRLIAGATLLNGHPIDWEKRNVYYWYYASQMLHHMGGEAWRDWNREMREILPKHQVASGREKGSWDPVGDRYGAEAGRLFTTCFSVYCLEVYYRHLPIYRQEGLPDASSPTP